VAHEIASATSLDVRLREQDLPVRDAVRSVCRMLGYDPYYLACEGRVAAVASPWAAGKILALWRSLPGGEAASICGAIQRGRGNVALETEIGGERWLEELEDDPLPRIC
jgi:hydrogenase expression/formation protein HypE